MQILERLQINLLVGSYRIALAHQQNDGPAEEEKQEGADGHLDAAAHLGVDVVVIHVVQHIQRTQYGGQKHHGAAQQHGVVLAQGLQAVPAIAPGTDHRGRRVGNGHLVHRKVGARKEGAHGCAHQEGGQDTVDHQGHPEALHAQQVFLLVLEFIGHGLEHEGDQKQHPNPVGAAETGAVEQREGSEESAAEGDQRSEGEFPFTAGGIENHALLHIAQAPVAQVQVGALHKHQGHQQTAQQGNQAPPIVL